MKTSARGQGRPGVEAAVLFLLCSLGPLNVSNSIIRSLAPPLGCLRFGQLSQTSGDWAQLLQRCMPFCQPRRTLPCCEIASPPPHLAGFPQTSQSMSSSLALALPQVDSGQPAQAGSKGNFYVLWHCHLGLSKRTPFFFLTTLSKTYFSLNARIVVLTWRPRELTTGTAS